MQALAVGVNHNKTPVTLRSKLAITASQLNRGLQKLSEYLPHGIILSTCNRTEIYVADRGIDEQVVLEFLQAWSGLHEPELRKFIDIYNGEQAFEHLFRVASGLDSMIIGEYEVLGQVRQALAAAEAAGMVHFSLQNLFHRAIGTGRKVRRETDISKNALSISSVAVTLAQSVVSNLAQCRILVIGAGEAGKLAARAAIDQGASQVVAYNRSQQRARYMVRELGNAVVAQGSLFNELRISDIVISCTSAPHHVLDSSVVRQVMSQRTKQPLVIIDIAVPCDVDPQVGEIGSVFLYNIDNLRELCDWNRSKRAREIGKAEAIIKDEMRKFTIWWNSLEVRPLISTLMQKAEKVRIAQLNSTIKKLPELSDEERYSLEAMTKAIVAKVLKDPIQYLKRYPGNNQGNIALIKELFRLETGRLK
jgi:glutamyl-tRNA reductase